MMSDLLKISFLFDNKSVNSSLQEGWGLSLFIEQGAKKILFDTGGCVDAFVGNVEKLNIRLEDVTHLVISHKHWDHRKGLEYVLEKLSKGTKVFLPKFFMSHFLKKKYPSLSFVRGSSFQEIDENACILSLKGGFLLYEQILLLSTSTGLVVITGCAHPGIVSILKEVKKRFPATPIACVMGGFHLFDMSPTLTKKVVQDFQLLGVKRVAPCHCSGDHVIRQFQEAYTDNFLSVGTGSVIGII
jgi:7,8-dihydropterin-6-yl-methyl-4-(beta-D-ribofuranosyl)aminobenzene 5'-phosphate synthase